MRHVFLEAHAAAAAPAAPAHFLRWYHALLERVRAGEVVLKHCPDEQMPADFLTKWIPRVKLATSVLYATGARLVPSVPSAPAAQKQ